MLIQQYLSKGIPLFPVFQADDGSRKPVKGWRTLKPNPDYILDPRPLRGSYGATIPKWLAVLDIDPRNFDVPERMTRFVNEHQLTDVLNRTFVVETPSGGYHGYLRVHPDMYLEGKEPSQLFNSKLHPGIEIKRIGHWVEAAGSKRIKDGKTTEYKVFNGSLHHIEYMPDSVFNTFYREKTSEFENEEAIENLDNPADIKTFRKKCRTFPEAIDGKGGNNTTYQLACHGVGLGLHQQTTFQVMLEVYNARLASPWEGEDLYKIVDHAYKYARQALGSVSVTTMFQDVKPEAKMPGEAPVAFDRTAKGDIKVTLRNVYLFLTTDVIAKQPNPIANLLAFNDFTKDITFRKRPPWGPEASNVKNDLGGYYVDDLNKSWEEMDTLNVKLHLGSMFNFCPGTPLVREGVKLAAQKFTTHPLRDHLESLEWDGVRRIDHAFGQSDDAYLLSTDDPFYLMWCSRILFLSAVNRVFHPGCKADDMIVLESVEGVTKSQFCAAIGGRYYSDAPIVLGHKMTDTVFVLKNAWIHEYAELASLKMASVGEMKAFLSRQTDRVRFAYEPKPIEIPRQRISIGTVNPDDSGYLTSRTGNRRFLPVRVDGIRIDKFRRDRDQIIAEAVARARAGEKHYTEDPRFIKIARQAQADRVEKDRWRERIVSYLYAEGHDKRGAFTIEWLSRVALNIPSSRLSLAASNRIADILRGIGFRPEYKEPIAGAPAMEVWVEEECEL